MIDFIPKYEHQISTTSVDENKDLHIGEIAFYSYFVTAKNGWMEQFVFKNKLNYFSFITRRFSVKISNELFHPSEVKISLISIKYNKLAIELNLGMYLNDKKIASCYFEVVPVDLSQRKVISKSSLYEKVQFN